MNEQKFHIKSNSTSALVSIICPQLTHHKDEESSLRSMGELRKLMHTLRIQCKKSYIQRSHKIKPKTFLGVGKLQEIADEAIEDGCDMLTFDFELSATQMRSIKKLTKLTIVDRNHLIMEIFAKHARTREAIIQIEIAKMNYLLPRLIGLWDHFSRQKGAIGSMGGEGEQQIELDRRIIQKKILLLEKELITIKRSRVEQRKKRKSNTTTVALVGYTNAGKSSLMNRLCKVNILEKNQLFSTLDSTSRIFDPRMKPPLILIDTVGFISNIPSTLIDGFKTTLESTLEADLLLIVCDLSDKELHSQMDVTRSTLKELHVEDKDTLIIFNKKDLMSDCFKVKELQEKYPQSIFVSSYDPNDMKTLKTFILNFFLKKHDHYDLFVPYKKGSIHSLLMSKVNIIKSSSHETGIFYRISISRKLMESLNLKSFILKHSTTKIKSKEHSKNDDPKNKSHL